MKNEGMNRRNFIKRSAAGVAGAGLLDSGMSLRGEEKKNSPLKIKNYRRLGRTGFKVSDISSGMPHSEAVLGMLLDAGVNYIDTASGYGGMFERNAGNVIKNRERESLFLTTKLSIKKGETEKSIIQRANESLERLHTDYVDCMFLYSADRAELVKSPAFHTAMEQLKKEKKVRFVGVSCHGTAFPGGNEKTDPMEKVLMTAVDDGRYDVILMVHNFLTQESSQKILNACREKNIGVALMKVNPVGDYLMVNEMIRQMEENDKPVPPFYNILRQTFKKNADRMLAYMKLDSMKNPGKIREAAIRFALNNNAVHTVNCTCKNFNEAENFLKLSGMTMTAKDKKTLALYRMGFGRLYCRHGCGECESQCPHQVPVNTIMRYNHYFVSQGREKEAMEKYQKLTGSQADLCSRCRGFCETACPHNVHVHALMNLAHKNLSLA